MDDESKLNFVLVPTHLRVLGISSIQFLLALPGLLLHGQVCSLQLLLEGSLNKKQNNRTVNRYINSQYSIYSCCSKSRNWFARELLQRCPGYALCWMTEIHTLDKLSVAITMVTDNNTQMWKSDKKDDAKRWHEQPKGGTCSAKMRWSWECHSHLTLVYTALQCHVDVPEHGVKVLWDPVHQMFCTFSCSSWPITVDAPSPAWI